MRSRYPVVTAPRPGSDLAARLDARRRAGLRDPDWTLSATERADGWQLLDAVSAAPDDPRLVTDPDTNGNAVTHRRMLALDSAGLNPTDTNALKAVRSRLVQSLTGDPPPTRLVDQLSVVSPRTGLVTTAGLVGALAATAMVAFAVGVLTTGWFALGSAVIMLLLCAASSLRVAQDDLRISSVTLDPTRDDAEVAQIRPDDPSFPLAARLVDDAKTVLNSLEWKSPDRVDEAADLAADRDRILTELADLDRRTSRLNAIAADVDGPDAAARRKFASEVADQRRVLAAEADKIAAHARRAIAANEEAERERRRARARDELDDLAAPPPQSLDPRPTDDQDPPDDDERPRGAGD